MIDRIDIGELRQRLVNDWRPRMSVQIEVGMLARLLDELQDWRNMEMAHAGPHDVDANGSPIEP